MDRLQAEKAMKNAWIAAIILAAISLFYAIYFSDITQLISIPFYTID